MKNYSWYIDALEVTWQKFTDICLYVAEHRFVAFIVSLVTSYFSTMKMLIHNTCSETFDVHNNDFIVIIAGVLGIFGLCIAINLIRFTFRFLNWLTSANSTEMREHGQDNRSQHNNGVQTVNKLESLRWLKQALCDLEAARNDIDVDRAAPEWVCYKCQQAMEKGLKAYVMHMHKDLSVSRMTHDLCDLAKLTNDTDLCSIAVRLQGLIGATPRMRYPDFLPFPKIPHDVYSLEDALTTHKLTETALKHIKSFLRHNTTKH